MAMVQDDYFAQKDGRTKVGRPARRFCRCLPRGKKAHRRRRSSVPWQQGLGGERDRERSMSAFSHNTRGLRSKIKVAAWSVSGESSFLSCRWPLLTVSSHGMRRDGEKGREGEGERETERTSSLASLLIRTLIPSQGPHLHDLI